MITGCSVCMRVHVTQQCYHHPPQTDKCYTILSSYFRDFCKQKTVLFFIMIGTTAKPWPALSIVFEALLVDSHSPLLYSSIYNLEEQFATSVETSLRDTDDYNVDENWENMCFKNHIWQHGQLKSKGITSLIRPSIAYFSYRDPSSTAYVKLSMKVRPSFFFVLGLLHLNLHPESTTLLPSRERKRCWWRAEWVP